MKTGFSTLCVGGALAAVLLAAQTPPKTAPKPDKSEAPAATGPILSYTATTENVAGAPDNVRIDLLRWSTDAERAQLADAWNMTKVGGGRGEGAGGRGAGRGGRGGGRGAAAAAEKPAEEDAPKDNSDPFGSFGKAGKAAPKAAPAEESPRPIATPESSLATALRQLPAVGYLWSSEVAGYAIHYAGKSVSTDGRERIILITDRRLGSANGLWKPTGTNAPASYDFSVVELRISPKGGEGKASITGKVALDSAVNTVAPENYDALPVVLKNVKLRQK